MRHSRAWERLERSIERWWGPERVEEFISGARGFALIADDAPQALRQAIARELIEEQGLRDHGLAFKERDFSVFAAQAPKTGRFPWRQDWRWDHTWPPGYFHAYDHYAERDRPYDVKFPWELSRLWFLLPVLQLAALPGGDGEAARVEVFEDTADIVSDWERENPLAYSVAWYPMEASMRGVGLVCAFDMLRVLGCRDAECLATFLRLMAKHGEFVYRTVEYTDVRGNHFAANLVAMLLLGLTLEGTYPQAQRWLDYAVRHIPSEIESQFLPDGIDFEKSIAYHRLVAELFLLGLIAMERKGMPVPSQAKERLRVACAYSAAYVRPDGLSPTVGDSDDAQVFPCQDRPVRDHRPFLGLAAAYWADPELKASSDAMSPVVPWFLGARGVEAWETTQSSPIEGLRVFDDGGVVIVRQGGYFLWMDVGEVGLRGRGGHGHNDVLSFELALGGHTLLVDPGTYLYTGDPAARNMFRSTAYHNGLRVDETEIAPLGTAFRIGNHAQPCQVSTRADGLVFSITAGHTGYQRLTDPVLHVREITLRADVGALECKDRIECEGRHRIERFLHLDPAVMAERVDAGVLLSVEDDAWMLIWDRGAEVNIASGWVSFIYGERMEALVITLTNETTGATDLSFTIEPFGRASS